MKRFLRIAGEVLVWLILACIINVCGAYWPVQTVIVICGLLGLMLWAEFRSASRK